MEEWLQTLSCPVYNMKRAPVNGISADPGDPCRAEEDVEEGGPEAEEAELSACGIMTGSRASAFCRPLLSALDAQGDHPIRNSSSKHPARKYNLPTTQWS